MQYPPDPLDKWIARDIQLRTVPGTLPQAMHAPDSRRNRIFVMRFPDKVEKMLRRARAIRRKIRARRKQQQGEAATPPKDEPPEVLRPANMGKDAEQKDLVKLFENEGRILRFTAQFYKAKPEDADRLFIVNFHLFDDTLSIHEPPQRNMGILTGKFLEKSIHLNQETGGLFKVEDFVPGSVIKVYNRLLVAASRAQFFVFPHALRGFQGEFEILDMDDYTRKYLEEGGVKRHFDLEGVLQKLREGMRQQYPLARDIFRKFDADHDGVLTKTEFKNALVKWGFQVTEEEALIIMKAFDSRKEPSLRPRNRALSPSLLNAKIRGRPDQTKLEEQGEREKIRAAVRNMGDVVYKHNANFMRLLKEFAHLTHENTVTCEQIVQALDSIGKTFSLEDFRKDFVRALLEGGRDFIPRPQRESMRFSTELVSAHRPGPRTLTSGDRFHRFPTVDAKGSEGLAVCRPRTCRCCRDAVACHLRAHEDSAEGAKKEQKLAARGQDFYQPPGRSLGRLVPCAVNAALPQVLGDATSTAMTRPRRVGNQGEFLENVIHLNKAAGQCDARSASQSSRLNCPASCNLGKLLVTSMENFDDELLPRILGQLLSGPAAVKSLRSCRSLKAKLWPRCLQAGEGLWIAEQLKMVSLEELLARDENLYACFMWARGSTNISKMLYNSLDHVLEIHRSVPEREPSKERETDMDQHKSKLLVARSLAESFMAIDGNETLELTRRRLGFPNAMSQQLPELFSGVLETVGEESPALLALGLAGWKVSEAEQISGDHRWRRFCFQRPRSKIPLAILHLSGEFDLPGMDGNVKASLAYLSLDFDYVVARATGALLGYSHIPKVVDQGLLRLGGLAKAPEWPRQIGPAPAPQLGRHEARGDPFTGYFAGWLGGPSTTPHSFRLKAPELPSAEEVWNAELQTVQLPQPTYGALTCCGLSLAECICISISGWGRELASRGTGVHTAYL
eukprot:s4713_g9.t1